LKVKHAKIDTCRTPVCWAANLCRQVHQVKPLLDQRISSSHSARASPAAGKEAIALNFWTQHMLMLIQHVPLCTVAACRQQLLAAGCM
jgi:hypothetical protein